MNWSIAIIFFGTALHGIRLPLFISTQMTGAPHDRHVVVVISTPPNAFGGVVSTAPVAVYAAFAISLHSLACISMMLPPARSSSDARS